MMTRIFQAFALTLALLLLPLTAWCQGPPSSRPINELERSALLSPRTLIEPGANVAGTACIDCHGLDGISKEPGTPNLAGQRTIYLYRVLQAYQARERHHEAMNHATGFLNDDALLAVSAYYANLTPSRPIPADSDTRDGTEITGGDPFTGIQGAMKKCVKCHGEDGNSSASGMPNLSAQSPEYFVASMKAYLDGSRNHKLMAKLAADLDEATLEKMGVFYAVQEPLRTETAGEGDAASGKALAEDCAGCHGDDGNASSADMPTLAGQDARYFTKAMQAYKEGKRQDQAMFDAAVKLSEPEVLDLAAFYASQQPIGRNVRSPLSTTEWIERCERCHGMDGNSTDPRFPMLAGQDRTYLANALASYIGSTRSSSIMHAMSDPLSESDIERIVEFYATREPKSVVYMQLPCEDQAEQ